MLRRNFAVPRAAAVIAAATLALLQFSGCGGGGSGSASTGTLKLSITDKLSDDFASVTVSIREVRVVPAGMENAKDDDPGLPVVARFATPKVIDVMQLQFVQQALGEVLLPAGTYHQVRLILEPNPNGQGQEPANYLVLKANPGVKIPLKSPSGQQSGLKVIGSFEVKPDSINAVMLDFDPNTAIVARGNGDYLIKPTGIRIVQLLSELTQFGSICGTAFSAFEDWSSATVSVKRRGAVIDTDPIAAGKIFSNYTSGAWQGPFAAFVPASSPQVSYKTFVAANGFRLYSSPAVTVNQGMATDLGVIPLVRLP